VPLQKQLTISVASPTEKQKKSVIPKRVNNRSLPKQLIEGKYVELSTIWTAAKEDSKGKNGKRVWRPRHIGIWSSKQDEGWIFLVLMAPLSTDGATPVYTENDFKFRLRDSVENHEEKSLTGMIDWFGNKLRGATGRYPASDDEAIAKLFKNFLDDVLWGWESYLANAKGDIRGVSMEMYFPLI
jgi:hypothetical protein